jgi:hypothetical protein
VCCQQRPGAGLLLGGNLHKYKNSQKCLKIAISGAKTANFPGSPSWTILEPFATPWQAELLRDFQQKLPIPNQELKMNFALADSDSRMIGWTEAALSDGWENAISNNNFRNLFCSLMLLNGYCLVGDDLTRLFSGLVSLVSD